MSGRRASVFLLLLALGCRRAPATALPAAGASPAPEPTIDATTPLPGPLPGVAGRVNGRPIFIRPVDLLARTQMTKARTGDDTRPSFYRAALQQLIERELLLQEALARGLQADDREVERAYDEARAGHKGDAAWTEYLTENGFEAQTFQNELRALHTIKALVRQEVSKRPPVTDGDAQAFYDANPGLFEDHTGVVVSHILIRVPQEATNAERAALRQRAEKVLERVRAGEDFARLARQHSDDIGTKDKGGRLDPLVRGQLPKTFEDAAFALDRGQTSGIVETAYGFHILRAGEPAPTKRVAFEQAKERLKQILGEQREREVTAELIKALRGRARIETYL